MRMIPWRHKNEEGRGMAPGSLFDRFRKEMDHVFDRFLEEPIWPFGSRGSEGGRWNPAMDVSEDEKEFTVRAELPGIDPKAVEITVTGDVLTLSGEKKEERTEKSDTFHRSECAYGRFERRLALPAEVDREKMEADFDKGILTIHLPKLQSAAPRRIQIKAG